MSEFRIGGLLFTSKFDSGNLGYVEKANQQSSNNNGDVAGVGDQENGGTTRVGANPNSSVSGSTSTAGTSTTSSNQGFQDQQQTSSPVRNIATNFVPSGGGFSTAQPDLEVNLWTRKDAANTPFENGNRTWFYYAVKGAPAGKYVKMNIMNLNRQFRLFQQGMSPVYRVLPHKPQWERIREKPSYMNVGEADFMISFSHRFEYKNATVEFAFCYPFSYTEYQTWLDSLDHEFNHCHKWDPIKTRQTKPEEIYYHRDMAIRSFDNNRVDLVTISSYHGISEDREHDLDDLFPDKKHPRPYRFRHKRVFFLSSRVHPGETPSSFVFNGFLKFILRKEDPRAIALRRAFVFKLMPLLNPDGVIRGHYRTDSRGVNLNRVYLEPDLTLHPPIFAARQILFYHHLFNALSLTSSDSASNYNNKSSNGTSSGGGASTPGGAVSNFGGSDKENTNISENYATVIGSDSSGVKTSNTTRGPENMYCEVDGESGVGMFNQSAATNGSHVIGDEVVCPCLAFNGKTNDCTKADPDISKLGDIHFLSSIHHKDSGIAFYVDLHGHASKRGCFMYGNHVENFDDHVENLLYPKIISLNTAHFDFGGCNFTEKNMYMKDKRDGASKEGAGRVAIFKFLGIIHSYTLECNYNTGRQTNCVAPACSDNGRATPPPATGFPPRYTPAHYEDVGKAVAIAALDMLLLNPWSRISMSEFLNVQSCRAWVQKFVQGVYNGPGVPRKSQIKIPGPKPMAQTYLSHLDKDDSGGIMSRNRFPLRNSRAHLMTSSTTVNETASSGVVTGGSAPFSSNSGAGGGGGFNGGSSNNSSNNNNSNASKNAGAGNVPRSLGPIRENKAFQMRRQRLLQIHRPALAQAANQSNASNAAGNNATTAAAAASLAGNHTQSFFSTVNNKQQLSSVQNDNSSAAQTPCHFGSIPAYQPLNSGSDALSISSSAMGSNCYQPLKHILHQVNSSSSSSSNPHSPHSKTATGVSGGAVIVSASVPHHSSTSSAAPAATTGRALYNFPVTNSSLPVHAGGMSTTAAAALAYLNANRSSPDAAAGAQQNDNQGAESKQGSASNIAGLAIISPRKNNSMLQKGGAPLVLANQMALSRTKLGINRSLSLLQQTAAGVPFIYSSAGASSSTHVPNNSEGPRLYAAYERASQSSLAFKNSSSRPTGSATAKKNAAPRMPIENNSSVNDVWASGGNKSSVSYSSNPKENINARRESNNIKKSNSKVVPESACYSSGDDEMYHSIATYVTSSKHRVEPSVETSVEMPAALTAEQRPKSSTNGNKRAPSAGSKLKTPENKKSQSQSNASKTAHNTSSSAVDVRGETRGTSSAGGGAALLCSQEIAVNVSKHSSNRNGRQQSAGGDYVTSSGPAVVVSGDESVVNYRKFSIKSASSSTASGKKRKNTKKSTTPNANATSA